MNYNLVIESEDGCEIYRTLIIEKDIENIKSVVEKRIAKEEKAKLPKPKPVIYYDSDLSDDETIVPENADLMEYFDELLETKIGRDCYDFVTAYGGDVLPDMGWEEDIDVKLHNRTFKLKMSFETQWCGDWSVRANLPDGYTLIGVTETTKK